MVLALTFAKTLVALPADAKSLWIREFDDAVSGAAGRLM
jgi:hypothetical protein